MIRSIFESWQDELAIKPTSTLFIRAINLIGFLLICWMLPIADMVWGDTHFTILYHDFSGFDALSVLLRYEFIRRFYWVFIAAYLILTLSAFLNYSTVLSRILTWFVLLTLHNGNYDISNGGWHILIQVHFLSIFLIDPDGFKGKTIQSTARLIHNVAFKFIWVQIVFLYFTSGIHKLFGQYWLSGKALFIVLNTPEFSHPLIFDFIQQNGLLLKLGNWFGLGYQLLFPFVIWIKRLRPMLLVFGLFFHLFILIFMGVTDFALILIAAYSVFIQPSAAQRINGHLSLKRLS